MENVSGTIYLDNRTLESVEHTEDKIVTIHRIRNSISHWPQEIYNDLAIKRIYEAEDGKIVLSKIIEGEYIPPETTKETIKWNE